MAAIDIGVLEARFGRPGAVGIATSPLGGPVVELRAGDASATVALQGAQVLAWRTRGRDLVWCSPAARLDSGRAVRGGIPVCWPWFGPHPTDPAKPQHGFVRTRLWQPVASGAAGGAASVTLEFHTTPADAALWPGVARVQLTVTLDRGLSLALSTENVGSGSLELTAALHTYFRVADATRVGIEGLDGCEYLDKVEGYARKRQAGPVRIAAEVDRIYLGETARIRLVDEAAGHRLDIKSRGSRSAVVWNPWVERTRQLGDMGAPDAFRQMLCIETANAAEDVVRLAPGGRHSLDARYEVA